MRTLAVVDGDLSLSGSSYAMLDGAPKVAQDLRLALGEPLGNDRFHPGWGSRLVDMVGLPLDEATRFGVEQEARRVITNYAAVQRDKIQRDTLTASRSRYQTSDVVAEVQDVRVTATLDTVQVEILLRTVDGQQVVLTSRAGG